MTLCAQLKSHAICSQSLVNLFLVVFPNMMIALLNAIDVKDQGCLMLGHGIQRDVGSWCCS